MIKNELMPLFVCCLISRQDFRSGHKTVISENQSEICVYIYESVLRMTSDPINPGVILYPRNDRLIRVSCYETDLIKTHVSSFTCTIMNSCKISISL